MAWIVCMASCTNNGDIGDLYGLWAMDCVTADGEDVPSSDCQDFFWRFQGDLVAINESISDHEHLQWIGTYARNGSAIDIDFSEGEVDTAFNPERIGLKAGKMHMQVVRLTGGSMILLYHADSGTIWQYALRKLK